MEILETLCTGNRRYRAAEPLTPRGVVLHSIGTPQPKASVLQAYWDRDASPYVTHYVLDDREILHCMPDRYKCWHVGSPGNDRWLGVELCEPSQITYTSGANFTVSDREAARTYAKSCWENAVFLLAKLCRDHGWDPFTAILTHREVTRQRLSNTDHVDPEHLWTGLGLDYDLLTLRRAVAAAMDIAQPEPLYRLRRSRDDAASQIGAYRNLDYAKAALQEGYAVFDEAGNQVYPTDYVVRITAESGLNVREGPGTDYPVVTALEQGGGWTIVEERGGWGKLKSGIGWISLAHTAPIS